MKLKEMEYFPETNGMILLAEGRHLGYRYEVISYMTHPCCYIQITNPEHPWYRRQYERMELDISGTLSYSRRYLKIPDENGEYQNDDGWWIGWDYMRTGYHNFGIPKDEMSPVQKEIAARHAWTTDELIQECENAITQIAAKIEWTDIFERWTEPNEYLKNRELGRIEGLSPEYIKENPIPPIEE